MVVEHDLSRPDHDSDVLDHVSDVLDAAKRRKLPADNTKTTVPMYLLHCDSVVELAVCLP